MQINEDMLMIYRSKCYEHLLIFNYLNHGPCLTCAHSNLKWKLDWYKNALLSRSWIDKNNCLHKAGLSKKNSHLVRSRIDERILALVHVEAELSSKDR